MGCRVYGLVITFGLLAALTACGGGGSGGGVPPHTPTPTPQPTVNPNAKALYSGTKTVTFTYNYAYAYPSPSPGATQPPSSTTYTVASAVTAGSSPDPMPSVAAVDLHTTETDTSPLATTVLGTDAWVEDEAFGSASILALDAQTQTEPSSANEPVTTTIYAAPQTIDEYPETNGASWSNSPAATTVSSSLGGSDTRTVAANGTYTDLEQVGNTGSSGATAPLALQENSDGSGTMSGYILNGALSQITFSAPSAASPSMIDIAFTGADAILWGGSQADPTWYATPAAFYKEADTVATGVSLPSWCRTSYGAVGDDVKRTIETLDTVVGYEETTTFDSFVIGAIPVCLGTTDVVDYAYLMQGDTPTLFTFGSLGLGTQITTETLVLQSGGTAGLLPADRPLISALQAHQLAAFSRANARRLRAFIHAHTSASFGGRK